jgi:hypothetical protein
MYSVAGVLALLVWIGGPPLSVPDQAKSAGAGACAILPKDEVRTIIGIDPTMFNMVAPREDPLPPNGSACKYMGATIQVDPFTAGRLEELRKVSGKEWTVVPNVGDAAYFHDRSKEAPYGEVYARAGAHVVTVQMSIDPQRPVETVRPKAVALAKALVEKLR